MDKQNQNANTNTAGKGSPSNYGNNQNKNQGAKSAATQGILTSAADANNDYAGNSQNKKSANKNGQGVLTTDKNIGE